MWHDSTIQSDNLFITPILASLCIWPPARGKGLILRRRKMSDALEYGPVKVTFWYDYI